jgi:hypothetical protein
MKRIFMSAHFGMLRSFNRRDTYSRRSAYPGYILAVNACTASAAACRWLNPLLALALSCAACGGSPTVLMAFRTEQQAQEHWRYRFGAALNLRSAPIGTTVSRGSALTPGPGGLASRASADVPAHVLPDRFATTPSMAVRKLFCK